jgi:MFS family permease
LSLSGKVNVALLSLNQCLYMTSAVTMLSFAGLVGHMLAANKNLSTLPVSLVMVGAASMTIPASFLMRRFGRRAGFMVGICCSILSGALGASAIWHHDFQLFCFAALFQGVYQAFAQYYRFAAIDVSNIDFRARAVSYVLGGGIGAALIAPTLARWSNLYFEPATFMGAYILISVLGVIGLIPISFLKVPPLEESHLAGPQRPISVIIRQPIFICAAVNAAAGYALMSFMMTAAPLAIVACGLLPTDASHVIQWHVLGMFLPSLFAGRLLQLFGTIRLLFAGALLFFLSAVAGFSGQSIVHFGVALVFLGIAWNFLFLGATTLLAEAYEPAEKAKIQGINEFLVFSTTATASLSAGVILNLYGWQTLNVLLLAILSFAVATTIWYALSCRKDHLKAKGIA